MITWDGRASCVEAQRTQESVDKHADAKVIRDYRDSGFSHADEDTKFRLGDEVVILTHSKHMPALPERWQPKPALEEPEKSATGQEARVQE